VIPDRDVQHIVAANAVFRRRCQQFRRHRLTLLRGAGHRDQLGRDRNQLDPTAFAGALARDVAGAQVLAGENMQPCKAILANSKEKNYES
jgi:hypothetical protein